VGILRTKILLTEIKLRAKIFDALKLLTVLTISCGKFRTGDQS